MLSVSKKEAYQIFGALPFWPPEFGKVSHADLILLQILVVATWSSSSGHDWRRSGEMNHERDFGEATE